jgi:heme-degrading monooxygenase HmoA
LNNSFAEQSAQLRLGEFMFINMATAKPLPGKDRELMARMKAFAEALHSMPGLVNVLVLREEETGNLVGLSIWKDRVSFESGIASVPPLPSKVEVTKRSPVARQFSEV